MIIPAALPSPARSARPPSRCTWALLVALAIAACSESDPSPPDYDALRKADDEKHADSAPPQAGTDQAWPSLAPAAGGALNVGIGASAVDGGIADAQPDAGSIAAVLSAGLFPSPTATSRPNANLFTSDPTAAVLTRAPFVIRTTSYTLFSFQWTASGLNATGFILQFGSEKYFYFAQPLMTGLPSGTVNMSAGLFMNSGVCAALPSTCYQTTMNVYIVTNTDAGLTYGLSPALSLPVAIDCGGCL